MSAYGDERPLADRPFVDNYPPLRDWLRNSAAICNWQLPIGNPDEPRAYVESYQSPQWTGPCVVVVWERKMGWELFTPANTNAVDATLSDASLRLKKG